MTANDPEKVLRKRSRRRFFKAILATLSITGGLWYYQTGTVPGTDTITDATDTATTLLSSEIDEVTVENDILRIVFAEDTKGEGFAVMHEYYDRVKDADVVREIPEFGGAVEVSISENFNRDYPTGDFDIAVYRGSFGEFSLIGEEIDRTTVTLIEVDE